MKVETMPNVKAILEHLRAQRAELDTTIRVLETLDNGASAATTDRAARRALAAVRGNGSGNGHEPDPKPARRAYGTGTRVAAAKHPRPDLRVPNGLTLAGLPVAEAVRIALQAAGEPLSTADLDALLEAGGFRFPRKLKMPRRRWLGVATAHALGHRLGDDGRWTI